MAEANLNDDPKTIGTPKEPTEPTNIGTPQTPGEPTTGTGDGTNGQIPTTTPGDLSDTGTTGDDFSQGQDAGGGIAANDNTAAQGTTTPDGQIDHVGDYSPKDPLPDYSKMPWMQSPVLYETASSDFSTTGLGVLSEGTWTVTHQESAPASLTMTYPLGGHEAADLQMGRVIMADAGYKLKRQLFRIDTLEPSISEGAESTIEVTAVHVAGDVLQNVITHDIVIPNATATQAFSAVLDALAEPMTQVTYTSDIVTVASVNWTKGTTIQDIMFGRSSGGTDMETLFDGEWTFDNYHFTFNKNAGDNTQIVVRPGKNLLSYSSTNSMSDVYTAIWPYATFTPGEDGAPGDNKVTDMTGVGTIQYVGSGNCPIWDSPFKGQKQIKQLTNGSYWKVFQTADTGTINGHTWYGLGGSQWVDASFFTFSKSGDYSVDLASAKVVGQGTIGYNLDNALSKRVTSYATGMGTISYVGKGKVALWNSPYEPHHITGEYVANGTKWKVSVQATDEKDHVWYQLGINQWIDSSYITFSKTTDYQPTIMSDTATGYLTIVGHTVKHTDTIVTGRYASGKNKGKPKTTKKVTKTLVGGVLYDRPEGKETGRVLKVGTRWKIFSTAQGGDGSTYYNLGGAQWIKDDDVSFKNAKDVEPKEPEDTNSEQVAGVAEVYDNPGVTGKKTGKTLKSGTQWKIFGQATTANGTWYDLGNNQWINSDYMTFDKPTDVEPNTDADTGDGSTDEDKEQTVLLDDVIMKAPGADKYEVQRIQAVDLSGYAVTDQDKLKEVATAYMSDNQIGVLTFSLDIAYSQFTGELAKLSEVGMFDRMATYLPQLKAAMVGEVNAITWDGNRHKPSSVTIGNRAPTITNLLQKYADEAKDAADAAASAAEASASRSLTAGIDNLRDFMANSIKDATDKANKRMDDYDTKLQTLSDTADSRFKDIGTDLNNTQTDVKTQLTTYKTGFDASIKDLTGKYTDIAASVNGVETKVNDPKTGLSSVSEQVAGLQENAVMSKDFDSYKQQTDQLITQKVSSVNGDYSKLSETVDGIAGKVSDSAFQARFNEWSNEIAGQLTSADGTLSNTIDQKVSDGLSKITLAVDDSGTGIQLIGGNGVQSVANINVDQAITNNLRALNTLSLKSGGKDAQGNPVTGASTTVISAWGMTMTGDTGPTMQIGSPGTNNGTVATFGDQYEHGTIYFKGPATVSQGIAGGDGMGIQYLKDGYAGAGLYVLLGSGKQKILCNYDASKHI